MSELGAPGDPALRQYLLTHTGSTGVPSLGEARAADQVPVVARLDPEGSTVPGLDVVSRFGGVVTARVALADLGRVRTHPSVRSLKSVRTYGPTLERSVGDVRATADRLPLRPDRDGRPLTGRGTLVAVLDWGVDVTHANLREADGRTVLEALWDQRGGATATSPEPFGYGRVIEAATIDAALGQPDPHRVLGYDHLDVDPGAEGTHGTHVADIVLGRGRAPGASPGVAPGARLLFVHLRGEDTAPEDTLGDSARILEAVDFAVRRARGRPLVIHLSLGRTGGPHDQTLLVTRALDHLLATRPGVAVVMSCGNYHDTRMHASVPLRSGAEVELPFEVTTPPAGGSELELWYPGTDRLAVTVVGPDGRQLFALPPGGDQVHREGDRPVASGFHRLADPNNGDNLVDLFVMPGAPPGTWRLRITGTRAHGGTGHAWIERTSSAHQARFPTGVADATRTTGSICNGRLPLAVGAYSSAGERPLMPFSSAGPSRDGRPKPDLTAPGGRIRAARSSVAGPDGRRVRDGLTRKSGTSMAAPHVSGAVALLFEAVAPRLLPMPVTRWLLMETARAPTRPDPRYGAGLLDAAAACRAAARLVPTHATVGATTDSATPPTGDTMTLTPAPTATDPVLRWLTGETDDQEPAEAVLGTLTLNRPGGSPFTHRVDNRTPVQRSATADDALTAALTDRAGHQVVRAASGGFESAPFGPAVCWVTTSVAGFEGDRDVRLLLVNGGDRVYVAADPAAPGTRRVDVPGLRSFFGLPRAEQDRQRRQWADRLASVSSVTAAQAGSLGIPVLRATLARQGARAFPVRPVQRGNPAYDAGGVVNGITLPPLTAPLREPHCYLPVISRVEGRMESINAWDAGAGISLGPIQFNVDRAALFRFLWDLRSEDPVLFTTALGTPLGWDMVWHTDHPDLVITRGTTTDTLHGRAGDRATNATYLMRGVPGPGSRDPDYRRRLAGCFRDAVVWPHVQELVVDTTAWWLEPHLTRIRAAGIGPLSPTRPDRETFLLTALLLSAGVRFSGCLPQILTQLARWTSVPDKLAHLDEALAATNPPCPDGLRDRLRDQRAHAATVYGQVQQLLGLPAATGAAGGEALPGPVEVTEGTGFRNEWADSILVTIRDQIAPYTPETWWDGMLDPVWLGRRFRNGIHEVLHRKLQAAEAELRRRPQYATLSDADLGRALGLREQFGGARSGRSSMHSFGLAVDIDYTSNPWILGQAGSAISNEAMRQACNHAALVVGGRVIDTAPPFLSQLARGGTGAAYDALQRLNRELMGWLSLAGNTTAVQEHVRRQAAVTGVLEGGETIEAAAARWAGLAQRDLDRLRLPGSNFHPRNPLRGFISLHRDLVVALRDAGRTAWGAIDFGPESGDVMHVDARADGVGRAVLAGIRAARRAR